MDDSGTVIGDNESPRGKTYLGSFVIDVVVLYDSFYCRQAGRKEPQVAIQKPWRDDEEEVTSSLISSRNRRATKTTAQVETTTTSCLVQIYRASLAGQQS